MSYENYKLEDFLTDSEFKNWVLHPDSNARLFWEKWIDSHPDQRDIILQARELILSYRFKEGEIISSEEQEHILEAVLRRTDQKMSGNSFLRYAVAACFVLAAAVIGFFIYNTRKQQLPVVPLVVKENPKGQKSKVRLPDGTIVWLNSDSRIIYPERFIHERNIDLEGEAYFEVAEDTAKPFKVTSRGIVTTALGTSFNINAFKEQQDVEVLLVSGKVSVEWVNEKNAKKMYVEPGELVVYNTENLTLTKSIAPDRKAILWKDGVISFERAGFNEIERKLERWYGISIEAYHLQRELHYTGDFDNASLERVLERMAFTERFTFEMKNDTVEIFFE